MRSRVLSPLLCDHHLGALLSLPTQERFVEVVETAAQLQPSAWAQALAIESLRQTMLAVEFRCRLKYQLFIIH